MISTVTNDKCFDFRGLSTDDKPINENVGNGSSFIEMDTGKIFFFDEDGQEWVEFQI